MLDLERRRITRDEAAKASRAMEALEVKPAGAVKADDANLIVRSSPLAALAGAKHAVSSIAVLCGVVLRVELTPRSRSSA